MSDEKTNPEAKSSIKSVYWRSPEEKEGVLNQDDLNQDIQKALNTQEQDSGASRRSFLKLAGFSLAATVAGCSRGPVMHAIPYLVSPEEIVPGLSYQIATTCAGCTAGCAALATCRDGRPTKLEGNPRQSWSGGLCAVGQASLLPLYDSHRFSESMRSKKTEARREFSAITWKKADEEIREQLAAIQGAGGNIRILSGTITSPSTLAAIDTFLSGFEKSGHVMFDPLSASSILEAHERTHKTRVVPHFRFDRAKIIASFDADFLGTWISPVEFSKAYAKGRNPDSSPTVFSKHYHFESRMSLTGSRSDHRAVVAPGELRDAIVFLWDVISRKAGIENTLPITPVSNKVEESIQSLSTELWKHRGQGLVISGSSDPTLQTLINRMNHALGNYGKTLDLARPSLQKKGNDRELTQLITDMQEGSIDALIVQGVNPAFDLPPEAGFVSALKNVKLVIRLSPYQDETSQLSDYVCAESHSLESWNDTEAIRGSYSLTQPTVPPLQSARTLRETLTRWQGRTTSDRDLVREYWRREIWPTVPMTSFPSFESFFQKSLHDGCYEHEGSSGAKAPAWVDSDLVAPKESVKPKAGELGLILYSKLAMLDGSHAHNPWLQELPDPVTKVSWDNYACLSPKTAKAKNLSQGDTVIISSAGGTQIRLPVQLQPGQHEDVVAVALGYGRSGTERFHGIGPAWLEAKPSVGSDGRVGKNASVFLTLLSGELGNNGVSVTLKPDGGRSELACSQDYHSLTVPPHLAPKGGEVRDAVRSTTLSEWKNDPDHAIGEHHDHDKSLWKDDHLHPGARWGLAVDLTACTGCSACVVSCQAENNIPVVGKDEMRRHREMHWMRIDRYYQGEGTDIETVHQPMMCQHCANAPCETVCPVLATVHSKEGLNQQVYNRCVGTRYCANNCPYKVRRFNWFDYPREDRLQNMSLNPDVTIRSRGVMEKCSLCVQRIQGAKAEDRRNGNENGVETIEVACQQSCPTSAIIFGDLNDPESKISRSVATKRSYTVLPELNTKPGVFYLAKVSNQDQHNDPTTSAHPTSG